MGARARLRTRYAGLVLVLACLALPAAAQGESVTVSVGAPLPSPEVVASMPESIGGYGISFDGGDGVWFNDVEEANGRHASYLTHYSPELPAIKRIPLAPLPPGQNGQDSVWGITPGLRGEELFLEWEPNTLAQITKKNKRKAVGLPEQYGDPQDLVVAADGTVWYLSRLHGCQLVHITAKAKVLSSLACGGDAVNLTIGPDGNIWVAAYTGSDVEEVSAKTGTVVARYSLRLPTGITTLGEDVYVAEAEPGAIAKIAPDGTITTYMLPAGRTLEWITTGADGAVWFDENIGPNGHSAGLARLSPDGELREVEAEIWKVAATKDAIYSVGTHEGRRVLYREPLSNFKAPPPSYVALGDSYSSGEGNPPYEPGSTPPPPGEPGPTDTCHRSEAYGPLLDSQLGLGPMTFPACSGAVTDDLFNTSAANPTEPRQFSKLNKAMTTLVTLTIGGDDAGFAYLMEHCVEGMRPDLHTEPFGCSNDQLLRAETQTRLSALEGKVKGAKTPGGRAIHSLLEVLEAVHEEAPLARIVIGGYPLLFGAKSSTYPADSSAPSGHACLVGTASYMGLPLEFKVDYFDAIWLNALGKKLDGAIKKATAKARAVGVPAVYAEPNEFAGHALCDADSAWFHPLELDPSLNVVPASFHPTQTGQELGYERAFALQLH